MRDFDQALLEKPPIAPAAIIAGPPRRVLVRLHDWDEDRPRYTVRYIILTERRRLGSDRAHHALPGDYAC
jgi:hypothetical protein